MYREFFGLRTEPFSLTPDSSFFYPDPVRKDALEQLIHGIRSGAGLMKVVGEVGTGKTTLCRQFLHAIGGETESAYILDPLLRGEDLLRTLARELGIDPAGREQAELLEAVKGFIARTWNHGRPLVLVIDEAQSLSLETLEQLRLLSKLETEKAKLLRIVLMGQPELDVRLQDPITRQLRQRIVHSCTLGPLSRSDLAGYVEHRMRVAGHEGGPVFRRAALRRLYRGSGGIPRLVNILAHKALVEAYGDGKSRVGRRHVRAAIRDTDAAQG